MGKEAYTSLTAASHGTVVNGQPIMATATPVAVQATSVQMVQVTAPADLAEGYQFEAEANGQRFLVTVPPGGVKAGQSFTVKAAIPNHAAPIVISGTTDPGVVGAWKDGLCSCFRHGCCHPHLCLSIFCTPIALAQVMTRQRLNWMGTPGSVKQVASTFKIMVGIFVLYVIISQVLNIMFTSLYPQYQGFDADNYETTQAMWESAPTGAIIIHYIEEIMELCFCVYIVIATCRARRSVREQYEIPEHSCSGCEDCCCAFWCQCCVTMQMMRHTADYDTYPGSCCTDTGLPSYVQTV
eukprot:CAMPEP_0119015798 /NCGR_PEP_ID=MMETSP1176-20130426/11641_1 /TAXON_ID=265551 /ORGANISM="Synedropsis recta cf, Strain CCMP1620" /LENGTH=295 /DNA_ID=CAMNT_0006969119 /DNA_START=92 /DNA_END=979 /DNA_ORIENTATION=+